MKTRPKTTNSKENKFLWSLPSLSPLPWIYIAPAKDIFVWITVLELLKYLVAFCITWRQPYPHNVSPIVKKSLMMEDNPLA